MEYDNPRDFEREACRAGRVRRNRNRDREILSSALDEIEDPKISALASRCIL